MINLLPEKEKQEIIFQKNRNLIIVLGSITIIFLICLELILLSLKFYVLQKISYERSILQDAQNQYETEDFLSLLDDLKKHNLNVSRADSFYKQEKYLSSTLKDIIGIERSNGIIFSNIAVNSTKQNNKTRVEIYGLSNSRDELISFKNKIESQPKIKNVYLPPDNLVKPTNISFHLSFDYEI